MATYKGVVPDGKYTFNAVGKTITFDSDYTGIALSDIMLITNVKSGIAVTLYDPFDSLKGGTLAGLVLTLAAGTSTAGMTNSDPLQIIVGMVTLPTALPTGAATESTLSTLSGKIPSGLTVTSSKLDVNIGTTGTVGVSSLPSLPAGSNTIGTVTANAGTGNFTVIQGTAANLNATVSLAAAQTLATVTNLEQMNSQAISMGTGVRDAGTQRVTIATNDLVPVSSSTSTTGGAVCGGFATSGNSTITGAAGAIVVRGATAQVYGWYFYNPNNTVAYVHFFNASTTVGITPGTTDPYYILAIPPVGGANAFGVGIAHSNGIVIGITNGRASITPTTLGIDYNIFYK